MLDEDPPDPGTPEFEDWKVRHRRADDARAYWRAKQAAARWRREDLRGVDGGLTCPADEP